MRVLVLPNVLTLSVGFGSDSAKIAEQLETGSEGRSWAADYQSGEALSRSRHLD